jgi:hypothetical protein
MLSVSVSTMEAGAPKTETLGVRGLYLSGHSSAMCVRFALKLGCKKQHVSLTLRFFKISNKGNQIVQKLRKSQKWGSTATLATTDSYVCGFSTVDEELVRPGNGIVVYIMLKSHFSDDHSRHVCACTTALVKKNAKESVIVWDRAVLKTIIA